MKITSDYIQAANVLRGKKQRNRVVAYVESYDDVLFWRNILCEFENETRYFEVMLPTRNDLTKGKKKAIMQNLGANAGEYMIACVDADYDYLLQKATYASQAMLENPYVFHTYAYAIENLQCYAPSLHNVCVMATLNDHAIFDFVAFLTAYSETIFPLFVWNIWYYRQLDFHTFSISDFNRIADLGRFHINAPEEGIAHIRHKVEVKLRELRLRNKGKEHEIMALTDELKMLGVTPATTYLYIQGHHLFDNIVSPIADKVCRALRNERETEIRQKAIHTRQRQNELSAYSNAQTDVNLMLRKNAGFTHCAAYKRLIQDLDKRLNASQPDNGGKN